MKDTVIIKKQDNNFHCEMKDIVIIKKIDGNLYCEMKNVSYSDMMQGLYIYITSIASVLNISVNEIEIIKFLKDLFEHIDEE